MGQFIGDDGVDVFQARLEGGVWKDWIIVGNGADDRLFGGEKNDKIYGNDDHDRLFGRGGDDFLSGGSGDDQLSGGEGKDQLSGGEGNDQLFGGNGNDFMGGSGGNDILHGQGNNDALFGVNGDDILHGGAGRDHLFGENGNDRLVGYGFTRGERDVLTGGGGADTFVLGEHNGRAFYLGGRGHALITDLKRLEGDKIQIKGSLSDYVLNDLSDMTGNGTRDTGIFQNGDLIAIVESRFGLNAASDFITATPPPIF